MKLFGFLFNWGGYTQGHEVGSGNRDPFLVNLENVPQFLDITGKQGVNTSSQIPEAWRLLSFRSNRPLAGEDIESRSSLDGDNFAYNVYVRTNLEAGTVIFASRRFSISEAAVMTLHTYVVPKLQRRNIRVAELAERLLGQTVKTDYFVTYLNTDVPGYGDSLKNLTLEGEDVAGAGFFRLGEQEDTKDESAGLPYANFTAKKIGLRPVKSRQECGRFGTDNRIECSDDALQDLEDFLGFVKV